MTERIEDIVDNILDGTDELNDYLDKQIRDMLKTVISTMFNLHSYTDDPIRVFFMIDVVVMKYVFNLLELYQDAIVESLKKGGLIADFSVFQEQRERMK